jgi:cytochrome c-type biogenesis protein CcmE
MQPRHKRLIYVLLGALALACAVALVLVGLRENVTYFYTPSDVAEKSELLLKENKHFRLGGMVEKNSVHKSGKDGLTLAFVVSDMKQGLKVRYLGLPPDLFREGQGVVAEGRLEKPGLFIADTLLAKHDEKYMPPEIAKSMKKNAK